MTYKVVDNFLEEEDLESLRSLIIGDGNNLDFDWKIITFMEPQSCLYLCVFVIDRYYSEFSKATHKCFADQLEMEKSYANFVRYHTHTNDF